MANSLSATKRARQSLMRNKHNSQIKAKIRTLIKKVLLSIKNKEKEKAQQDFATMQKNIDKVVNKGLIHKNQAARKKSRLSNKIKQI